MNMGIGSLLETLRYLVHRDSWRRKLALSTRASANGAGWSSGDGLLVELTQTEGHEHDVKEKQTRYRRDHGQVRELGHQRSAQALAGIHERIDQHDFLHDGEVCEGAPRIVRAAKKDHGCD